MLLLLRTDDNATSKAVERSRQRLEDYKRKVMSLEGFIVNDIAPQLRGWEGQSSKIYFDTLNLFLPEEFRFERRTQRPAMDVANAFLNYGYGLLYSKIEGDMIKAGIDPYIGVMHRDDYNRPVLVYDVIELYRVWVEYVVYSLLAKNVITDDYYSVRDDGSYWLERLGRQVIIQSMNDYMDDEITQKGVTRSRKTQMFLTIQNLAQQFKNFDL